MAWLAALHPAYKAFPSRQPPEARERLQVLRAFSPHHLPESATEGLELRFYAVTQVPMSGFSTNKGGLECHHQARCQSMYALTNSVLVACSCTYICQPRSPACPGLCELLPSQPSTIWRGATGMLPTASDACSCQWSVLGLAFPFAPSQGPRSVAGCRCPEVEDPGHSCCTA